MTILYFGIYNPGYARNKVLIKGLEKNGVRVLQCRVSAKDRLWPLKLLFKYLGFIGKFDAMVVGFPGQEVMFLARFLTLRPVIFDAFTSHYGGYILDRKYYSPVSLRAKYYRFLDTWSCRLAGLVLLDTQAHIDFFVREFGLKKEKFRRIWIGADDDTFFPRECGRTNSKFTVLFFGTYIPLQGVAYIMEAAEILRNELVEFLMVGSGKGERLAREYAETKNLFNVVFYPMLEHSELVQKIECADICLGIFGDTLKTGLVIPNKVYEALAMRKTVITADTPALRELFNSDDLYPVPAADGSAIAGAILKLKSDAALRENLAGNGYRKFKLESSMIVLGRLLKNIIQDYAAQR